MNAIAFRHFYDYHFSENRKLWDNCIAPLTVEQFTQAAGYSHGSVRDQIVHLIDAEEMWFCELRVVWPPEPLPPPAGDDRAAIRARWDSVEEMMRAYLAGLSDEALFSQPIKYPEEDAFLATWQVLLHVANHGTDHRAQLLRQLNDLGVATISQDYIFFTYDNPVADSSL